MSEKLPLKIAVVAGEESGDLLGADLVDALRTKTDRLISLVGVGGTHLQQRGLQSLFDPDEIALMGIGAVLARLPKLIMRISQTAKAIVAAKPDCLLIIDSPDFTHRVAKKVRQADPSIPIIKYIAPTVWAWRPHRAKEIRKYIDHVLTVLPFEVEVMQRLSGPKSTYVGHRLTSYQPLLDVSKERKNRKLPDGDAEKTILLLPGSRRSEIQALLKDFGATLAMLHERGTAVNAILPTPERHEAYVQSLTKDWPVKPLIVSGEAAKWDAFTKADVALAASGTVSLELALTKIPTVITYKADLFSRLFLTRLITVWSASLPNIIDDTPVIPEFFNEFVRVGMLCRQIEGLLEDGLVRNAQIEGFERIIQKMHTEKPAGELGADVLLELVGNGKAA
ncbi:lipid-A-disaccharide synthase [Pseudochrobactrum sp. sp1633]|uniref:lipid-A-disaccharide synthase n=1 Tax=Pseudochrobactrum sp. sp1633 TaxID=3036706 RepID=UPI0025A6375C|nr:lipid-A-disaccharide synthase [Pseudochrobactrum sp. sp1633]MDM8344740.1 lipid-A-disaccharide synthase [Pseudochrobactrum sp. sp1633]HWD13499.1 lipid-A-disaccharide synthase [Pseudochrobactrum sp.]